MPYPPAPWKAKGFVVQTLRLIDVEKARRFVPSELEIVSVLPGKTLGSVYIADYGPGSALEYNELIVAPALTRRGRTIRFWISHIYVDNRDSMAGGREIWGCRKRSHSSIGAKIDVKSKSDKRGDFCVACVAANRVGCFLYLFFSPLLVFWEQICCLSKHRLPDS